MADSFDLAAVEAIVAGGDVRSSSGSPKRSVDTHTDADQLFVSQRVVRAHNAVRYATAADQHRDPTVLNVHPADAASNAITDGAAVRVRNGTRTVTASAHLNRQNRGRHGIAHARRRVAQRRRTHRPHC